MFNIIHQIADIPESKWKHIWKICQKSWPEKYKDCEYILWDSDKINSFLNSFQIYKNIYESISLKIMKIDMLKIFILYEYGGMYADMDYMCVSNFKNDLKGDLNIVESSVSHIKENKEYLQNSLIICNKKNSTIKDIMNSFIENLKTNVNDDMYYYVKNTTGPIALSRFYKENNKHINVLPKNAYNPFVKYDYLFKSKTDFKLNINFIENMSDKEIDNIKAIHLHSGAW